MYTLFPLSRNPDLVKLAACLLLRFLNLGGLILVPFLLPCRELKKFLYAVERFFNDCCNETAETWFSHFLSSVFFVWVNRLHKLL